MPYCDTHAIGNTMRKIHDGQYGSAKTSKEENSLKGGKLLPEVNGKETVKQRKNCSKLTYLFGAT